MKNLNIGYCCLNVYLRQLGIFTSRTCRLETIKQNGIEHSYELARQNLEDLCSIIRWNHRNNINLYRMSSEMFPFATHPDYYKTYDLEQFSNIFITIGQLAQKYNQTVTAHPSQFNVLSSNNPITVDKTIIELDFHARIMDLMNLDKDSVIVIHGGSMQDGKQTALDRFKTNFIKLSKSAQERLVIENCETMYSIEDLLPLSRELSTPIILDFHHHNINPGTRPLSELTNEVLQIWNMRRITPLFHLSESKPGITKDHNIMLRRAHSDYVTKFPEELLNVIQTQRVNLDIEAKAKEQAVLFLYKKYSIYPTNDKYIL